MKLDWKVIVGSLMLSVAIYPAYLVLEASVTGTMKLDIAPEWCQIIGITSMICSASFAFLVVIMSLRDKKEPTVIYKYCSDEKYKKPFLP